MESRPGHYLEPEATNHYVYPQDSSLAVQYAATEQDQIKFKIPLTISKYLFLHACLSIANIQSYLTAKFHKHSLAYTLQSTEKLLNKYLCRIGHDSVF